MSLDFINLLNFTLHVLLVIVKILLIVVFYKGLKKIEAPNNEKLIVYNNYVLLFIVGFSCICIWSELYFLVSFYEEIDLYYYEFSAILDQIISALLIIYYFKKGLKNE